MSMREALSRLRRKSPVAHRRTTDIEICETTMRLRKLQIRPGRLSICSPFKPLPIEGRTIDQAGTRPKRMPARTLRPKVHRSTLPSRFTERSSGTGAAKRNVDIARVAQSDSATPTTPPLSESITLSVNIWHSKCHRVAPNASRTTISR